MASRAVRPLPSLNGCTSATSRGASRDQRGAGDFAHGVRHIGEAAGDDRVGVSAAGWRSGGACWPAG
jgi:hypothetical protein